MLMFALIGLLFVLLGVTGLQFTYLFYVDRLYRERQKYLRTLESKHARLAAKYAEAETLIAKQEKLLGSASAEYGRDDEAWADVIEEL